MTSPIPELILGGACDDDLDLIFEACKQRRQVVAERKALALEPGDEFYVKDISPKKLNGVRVKFVRHDAGWLRCELLTYVDSKYYRGSTLLLRRTHVGQIAPRAGD